MKYMIRYCSSVFMGCRDTGAVNLHFLSLICTIYYTQDNFRIAHFHSCKSKHNLCLLRKRLCEVMQMINV